jgi:hypothetical protein
MKKTSKKILGGLMVGMLVATIGAVIASAQPFFSDLTDEQKAELKETRDALMEEGATCQEIKDAMHEQLESYGIEFPTREEILDKRIEQTEQRLEILKRTRELIENNSDITREEIREIIEEEFDLEYPYGEGMMHRRGFRRGSCGCGPYGFGTDEESE